MRDYLRATVAECFKLKWTSALLAAIIVPYVAILFVFFEILAFSWADIGWAWLGGHVLTLWSGFLLPLLVCLTAAFLAELESRNRQWKHLFALPVPRGALYGAKYAAGVLLLLLSHVLLILGVWTAGLALRLLKPDLAFTEPFSWELWLSFTMAVFAAAGLILALQLWLSLRMRSVVLVVGMGLFATIFAATLDVNVTNHWYYFPWRLPYNAIHGLDTGIVELRWVLLGIGGGLLCATIGGWEFTRRDVV